MCVCLCVCVFVTNNLIKHHVRALAGMVLTARLTDPHLPPALSCRVRVRTLVTVLTESTGFISVFEAGVAGAARELCTVCGR